jgi:hypothetical protein
VQIAAWKALRWGRHLADSAGALERRSARELARSQGELARHLSFASWLARPGAGRLWVEPANAAEWAITTCTADDEVLAVDAMEGRIRLLGADRRPRPRARWRTDLYSGIEWPLEPAGQLHISRQDGSDIRTVWEHSRAYHFIPLARCYWSTRDARFAQQFVKDVTSWVEQNPVGLGPNWASPMDTAIRAANWSIAAVLFANAPDVPPRLWPVVVRELRMAAFLVERHMEWHPRFRGNHYLANVVGLLYVGALFKDSRDGARWLRQGAKRLEREMRFQVGDDGIALEGALAYHRLDTELFAYGSEIVSRNCAPLPSSEFQRRLLRMYAFIASYLPPGGEAPMLGDADDGRLHAVSARGLREPRRHALGLPEQWWAQRGSNFRGQRGGFWVLSRERDHCVIRAGAVGLHGAGSHDHNDQLSLELVIAGRRVIADRGTYAYTRNLAARHAFRSTAAHSGLQLRGEEQNPISPERPWRVRADTTRTVCLDWQVDGECLRFVGEHQGFRRGDRCRREVESPAAGTWTIRDSYHGPREVAATWRLQLATAMATLGGSAGRWTLQLPGAPAIAGVLEAPVNFTAVLESVDGSDRYGVLDPRSCVTLHGVLAPGQDLTLRLWEEP